MADALDYRTTADCKVLPLDDGAVPRELLEGLGRLMDRLQMDFGAADFKACPRPVTAGTEQWTDVCRLRRRLRWPVDARDGGVSGRSVNRAVAIPTPDGLAEVLRACWVETDAVSLRDALYQRAFARDLAGDPPPASRALSISELAQLLSAANQGRDRWVHGWRIEGVEASGAIVASCGALRHTAKPGEYALTFTEHLPPRAGMAATLYFPRESLTLQSGVYYAFGAALPEEGDEVRPLRFYLHAPEAVLPEVHERLTGRLNRMEIPFTLKTMLAPAERDRSDATVLYVARRARRAGRIRSEAVARVAARTPGSPSAAVHAAARAPGLAWPKAQTAGRVRHAPLPPAGQGHPRGATCRRRERGGAAAGRGAAFSGSGRRSRQTRIWAEIESRSRPSMRRVGC